MLSFCMIFISYRYSLIFFSLLYISSSSPAEYFMSHTMYHTVRIRDLEPQSLNDLASQKRTSNKRADPSISEQYWAQSINKSEDYDRSEYKGGKADFRIFGFFWIFGFFRIFSDFRIFGFFWIFSDFLGFPDFFRFFGFLFLDFHYPSFECRIFRLKRCYITTSHINLMKSVALFHWLASIFQGVWLVN